MGWTVWGPNPGGGRDFPLNQTGPGAHPASYTMGTRSFPGVKCGRGVLLSTQPPSSTQVLEEYSYSSTPFWATTGPVTRLLYFTFNDSVYKGILITCHFVYTHYIRNPIAI